MCIHGPVLEYLSWWSQHDKYMYCHLTEEQGHVDRSLRDQSNSDVCILCVRSHMLCEALVTMLCVSMYAIFEVWRW